MFPQLVPDYLQLSSHYFRAPRREAVDRFLLERAVVEARAEGFHPSSPNSHSKTWATLANQSFRCRAISHYRARLDRSPFRSFQSPA